MRITEERAYTAKQQCRCRVFVHIDAREKYIRMRASVLLIDDDAVQAAIRQTILKRAGYHVVAALSPERALQQIQTGDLAVPIGLVITDHIMPGMSGSMLVRLLRKTHPSLPVMVISGLEEAETEYVGLGVTFRVKPLLPESLLANVKDLMSVDNGSE